MPDWTDLRRRAQQHHLRLCARLPAADRSLPAADALLQSAEQETGVKSMPLPPEDSLLSGAQALLDRETDRIWYARAAPPRQRFAQAHEFAHYWLHPELATDAWQGDEALETFVGTEPLAPSVRMAARYSPAERRETEANVFAAELLLPAPALRRAFVEQGWRGARIATHVGVSVTCVLAQLANALLLPPPSPTVTPDPILPGERSAPLIALDPSQRCAAEIVCGPTLVEAGPGTGKTRTLVARIQHLLRAQRVAPENVLALTFSNKAAEEMRSRLRSALGEEADRVWIGTFHAFGYELLKKEGHRIGLSPTPLLLETNDAIALLTSHLDRLPLDRYEYLAYPQMPFADILHCISCAKDALKTPADYREAAAQAPGDQDKALEVAAIYEVYQALLTARGALDFGDLIMRAVALLRDFPDVRADWQAQFPHILADEFQDVNRASAYLLRELAGEGHGLWVVGDARQAIYRFRGASPANIRAFRSDFPGASILPLQRNYRSRPALVSLFGRVAQDLLPESAADAASGAWEAVRPAGANAAITQTLTDDEATQADALAAQIQEHAAAGVALRDQAILCRNNRHAAELAAQMEARGVAIVHLGSLFDRPEIKDLLALLHLVCEPTGATLARVATLPQYAVPPDDIHRLLAVAQAQERPFPKALKLAATLPGLSPSGREGCRRLRQDVNGIARHNDAWSVLTHYLFATSDYLRPLLQADTIANRQRLLAIHQLLQLALSVRQRSPAMPGTPRRAALRAQIAHLMTARDDKTSRLPVAADTLDGVRLMTIHQAKGLEFAVVHLPNLVEGQFPPKKQGRQAIVPPGLAEKETADLEEAGDAEGEACLFFVALSRARDHLALYQPVTWNAQPVRPSSLLAAIEGGLTACGAQILVWAQPAAAPIATALPETIPLAVATTDGETRPEAVYSLAALEQYQNCPRQFWYARVANLPQPEQSASYLAFHRCLQQTTRWLQAERLAGRTPALAEAQVKLEANWRENGPEPDTEAHARVLKRRAQEMLTRVYTEIAGAHAIPPELSLVMERPEGSIHVPVDHAEHLPDGTLRLVRYDTGHARDSDHTEPRFAALRAAARQQDPSRPVQIEIFYLRNGQRRDVKESKAYEPKRLAKYDAALQGIHKGNFLPRPDDRKCGQCPFFLICPI